MGQQLVASVVNVIDVLFSVVGMVFAMDVFRHQQLAAWFQPFLKKTKKGKKHMKKGPLIIKMLSPLLINLI